MLEWSVTADLWASKAKAVNYVNKLINKTPETDKIYVSEIFTLDGEEYDEECFGYAVWTPKHPES